MDNFPNTRAAMKVFDADLPRRVELWRHSQTNKDIHIADKEDELALNKVRKAFFKDTKEFNLKSECMRVPEKFMRKVLDSYPADD